MQSNVPPPCISHRRRAFVGSLAGAAALLLAPNVANAAAKPLARPVPSTGEMLPAVGLGSWITFNVGDDRIAQDACADVMREFFAAGGRLIDSSPMYGSSQPVIGYGLRKLGMPPALLAADKVWIGSGARGPAQIETSRTLWGVPRFDLLQVHNLLSWQEHLPTLFAMKADGRLRYVGITTSEGRRPPRRGAAAADRDAGGCALMSEWWTYRLSSFVLFSPRTYLRLMEIYNAEIWPLQIVGIAVAIAMVIVTPTRRTFASRAIPFALAATWLFVAWAFFLRRYATINWAASHVAVAFVAEALLLAWTGATGRLRFDPGTSRHLRAGLVTVAVALAGLPLAEWLAGRSARQLEWFGVAPDPTAIGTLGVLLLAAPRAPLTLLAIPLLWCVANGAFQWTLGMRDALVLPLTAFLVLATRWAPSSHRSPRPSAR